jgi:flagellar biosynthesis/type III secretory pathway chaperone
MEELLKLLVGFRDCLSHQMRIFQELLPVLDREEELVLRFDVGEFERLVTEKDQTVRRAQAVEEKRVALLRRICFLIGYDARGQLPTLKDFLSAFDAYVTNVATLLEPAWLESLADEKAIMGEIASEYLDLFQKAAPRIKRNQTVLSKMAYNFSRSLSILKSESSLQQDYDAAGRTRNNSKGPESNSFVRVKA